MIKQNINNILLLIHNQLIALGAGKSEVDLIIEDRIETIIYYVDNDLVSDITLEKFTEDIYKYYIKHNMFM